jgi:hypothetical protein
MSSPACRGIVMRRTDGNPGAAQSEALPCSVEAMPHGVPSDRTTQTQAPGVSKARTAKMQNRTPPARSTVRSEMELASNLPPITASPVQREWPMHAPKVTPNGSRAAACVPSSEHRFRTHASRHESIELMLRGQGSRYEETACIPVRSWQSETDRPTQPGT